MAAPTSNHRRKLREDWIRRFTGYFGEPASLGHYRAGEISFGQLYRSSMKMAENMVTEAERVDSGAFSSRDNK